MTSLSQPISVSFTTASPTGQGAVAGLLLRAALQVALWDRRARGRAALARLDPAQCRDVGLTEAAARVEAALPFWKA